MALFRILLIALYLFSSQSFAQSARIYTLTADEWARPRSGEVVASFSSLRSAVDYWQKTFSAVFLIRYPGEDSGELWALELKDWMVSLGIPNDVIFLASGLEILDELQIVVGKSKDLNF